MILWIVLFFITGILLIFAEFFLPGMVLGTIGGLLLIISGALGVYHYPDYAVFIVIGELAGVALGVVMGFYVLSRTRAGNLLIQREAQLAQAGYVSAESDMSLLNCEGTALTALRPAGTIMVGDKRVDAVSDGTFIEANKRVIVTEVHGSRVVVEEIREV